MKSNRTDNLSVSQVEILNELQRRRFHGLIKIDETCKLFERLIVHETIPKKYSKEWLIPIFDAMFNTIVRSITEDDLTYTQTRHINTLFDYATSVCTTIGTLKSIEKAKEWAVIKRIVNQFFDKNVEINNWLKERNPYIALIELISIDKVSITSLRDKYKQSQDDLFFMINELKSIGLVKQCLLKDEVIAFQLTDRGLAFTPKY